MISIVKSLGAVLGASLLESQAWERHTAGNMQKRMNVPYSVTRAKFDKVGADMENRKTGTGLYTKPLSWRSPAALSKSASTMPIP